MDKSFVKIDDLIRQRLVDGEEQERAGAWLNMRELLDKEMPQKPMGFFNWRRMFSAMAVLLLVGTVGVGGYKIATSQNSNDKNTDAGTASVSTNSTPVAIGAVVKNNEISNQIATSGIPGDQQNDLGNLQANDRPLIAANEKNTDNNEANKQLTTTDIINNPNNTKQNDVSNTLVTSDNHIKGSATGNVPGNVPVNNNNESNYANNEISNNKEVSKEDASINSKTAAGNIPTSTTAVAIANTNKPVNNADKIKTSSDAMPSGKPVNKESVAVANVAQQKKHAQKVNAAGHIKADNKGTIASTKPETNHNAGATAKNNVTKTAIAKTKNVSVDKMALSSHAPSAKNIAGINGNKVINSKTLPDKTNKTATGKTASARSAVSVIDANVPVLVAISGKKIPSNRLLERDIDRVRENANDKTVKQKIDIVEHVIRTTPGNDLLKLDTISNETLTEELGVVVETKTTVPANTPATGRASAASANKGAGTSSAIIPAAVSSAAAGSGITTKENAQTKNIGGASTIENLNSAFNDIKYHIAGVQFAPGLTAGVNGTFFGPNSFKGFQFGFVGNFVFSDKFSVMSELKYFQRINNDYSLNDNYYSYTPVNGGYSKELQLSSYSVSTLHSFEMPITIHYCQGRFDFYTGGNLVYSFAINTGAATQSDPANTSIAQAIGNDNTPKLKEEDFGARFGIGYLFGMSYHISPNVMLDFRNVQTMWDNAKSDGAALISNQLYKSPSLQLSFGYRLGSNKNKKE